MYDIQCIHLFTENYFVVFKTFPETFYFINYISFSFLCIVLFTVHSHCPIPIQIKCPIPIILLYIPMYTHIRIDAE